MVSITLSVLLMTAYCIWVGKILTENPRYALSILFEKLNRKPFNCRPCLTFHLIWILHLFAALACTSLLLLKMGALSAIVVYIVLYVANKMKIIK